jgi:tRNA-dihydrouridine synthase B
VFDLNEKPPLVSLAPMAGVTDIPFRRQVKAFGGQYCVSEMVASDQLALRAD